MGSLKNLRPHRLDYYLVQRYDSEGHLIDEFGDRVYGFSYPKNRPRNLYTTKADAVTKKIVDDAMRLPAPEFEQFKKGKLNVPYGFGIESTKQYNTLHPKLQRIMDRAIQIVNFTIVEGHRNKEDQDKAFAKGNSKEQWPNSKHNALPSLAADCVPYPVDWSDAPRNRERNVYLMGIFKAVAYELGIKIREGIDWNQNDDMRDEKGLHDYPHIELDKSEA